MYGLFKPIEPYDHGKVTKWLRFYYGMYTITVIYGHVKNFLEVQYLIQFIILNLQI